MEKPIYNIFKIKYVWYEGDERTSYLAKAVTEEQFEKDILKARDFARSLLGKVIKDLKPYLGKGYSVECLPEFYQQIIWYLTEKLGYLECEIDDYITYFVEDDYTSKIDIRKQVKKYEFKILGGIKCQKKKKQNKINLMKKKTVSKK